MIAIPPPDSASNGAKTMLSNESLITEIEDAMQSGTPDKRADTLRSVTDLFVNGASRLNEDQVVLFDEVIGLLIDQIEIKALVELGERLAPIANAPSEVIARLARHDNIAVAGPVLAHSDRLSPADLVDIAQTKGQAHLLALSSRARLDETVTDVLVRRGNDTVLRKVAGNSGARFSHDGFGALMERARNDGVLAERVVQRNDIPPHLFRALVTQATDVVREHILAVAPPETRDEIERVLAKVSAEVAVELANAREQSGAAELVRSMHQAGKLGEPELVAFAKSGKFDETVAALALLSAIPVEVVDGVMRDDRVDPIMILCKAAGLEWRTLWAVISLGRGGRGASALDLEAIREDFAKLSRSTARRVLRFWQVRRATQSNGEDQHEQVAESA
jgi:uncharacterized protein (DUF2336 family)